METNYSKKKIKMNKKSNGAQNTISQCNGPKKLLSGYINSVKMLTLNCLLIVSAQVHAQQVNLEWVHGIGGVFGDMARTIALDDSGNVYMAGYFFGTVDFDPGAGTANLVAAGEQDIFVAKYDGHGKYIWAINMGGYFRDDCNKVAVDKAGNVYITGFYMDTADFDPGPSIANLVSISGGQAFIAKYDTDGKYLWAKSIESDYGGQAISVDYTGNVYATYVANYDVFLAKYDPDGRSLWTNRIGGAGTDVSYGMALTTAGEVYITGHFEQDVDFNPDTTRAATLTSKGLFDAFLAKYDANGNYLWAKRMGGKLSDIGMDVALDRAGNVYVFGRFFDTADFNSGSGILIGGERNVTGFLVKYDATGNFLWTKNVGGKGNTNNYGISSTALALDALGNAYITGYFWGIANFDPGPGVAWLPSSGARAIDDIFIARYDSNGNYIWVKYMEGISERGGNGVGAGIVASNTGSLYLSGWFNGSVDFNTGGSPVMLTSKAYADAFLLKLTCYDTTSSYLRVKECKESYTLNGTVYTSDGIYTQHILNTVACDSTITLDLTFYELVPVVTIDEFLLGLVDAYVSYQWIKNGEEIPGATYPTYLVKENADYQVRVVNDKGCVGISDVYKVTNVPASSIHIDNNSASFVRVAPNPVSTLIHISSTDEVHVYLCSLDGRRVLHIENAKAIPVQNLAAGMYLLHITDKNGNLVKVTKIIKE